MRNKEAVFLLAFVLLALSLLQFLFFIGQRVTGEAIYNSVGNVSVCIDAPPAITAIADQTATVSTAFELQVVATDSSDSDLSYRDNTTLFTIGESTGLISFTPAAGSEGTEHIRITAEDDAGCLGYNVTDDFILTINAAAAAGEAAAAAAGGGGAGAAVVGEAVTPVAEEPIQPPSISVSPRSIRTTVRQSASAERTLTVTNDGDAPVDITVSNPLSALLDVAPDSFTLSAGERHDVTLTFNPDEDAEPNVYTGLLEVRAENDGGARVRNVNIILEVESDEILFDSSLDLDDDEISVGDELEIRVTLINVGGQRGQEVTVTYQVFNFENDIVHEEEERVTVQNRATLQRTISLDLAAGDYVLVVRVVAGDSIASATERFTIEADTALAGLAAAFGKRPLLYMAAGLAVLAAITLAAVLLARKKAAPKIITKITKITKVIRPAAAKPAEKVMKTERLRKKLSLLEESYHKGYLSKGTYLKSRQALEQEMSK